MAKQNQTITQSRSAHAAIKGYEYQFDRTLLEMLDASAETEIVIEGIEDIDLHAADTESLATQVKYYESQKYSSPKSLRDPVYLMLQHYQTGARWQYILHVHFGDFGEIPDEFSIDEMKNCLTKKEKKTGKVIEYFLGIDDESLKDFCSRLTIRTGDAFEVQQQSLMKKLVDILKCSDDEVAAIYLAKARDFVHEKARTSSPADRAAKRDDLLAFLNVREILFSRWQLEKLGEEKYLKAQIMYLKQNSFEDPKKRRGLYAVLDDNSVHSFVELAMSAGKKHLERLSSAKPWTFILSGSPELITHFKTMLIREGIVFNDGLESIEFSINTFNEAPIVNLKGNGSKIKASSHVIRVVTEENFRAAHSDTSRLGRLLVVGDKSGWHDEVADQTYELKNYESGFLQTLVGAVL